MPALIRGAALAGTSLFLILAGCSRHSEEYRRIKNMEESRWIDYARHIPLNTRLGLYEELYKSTTPPNTVISESFRNQPLKSFNLVVSRMASAGEGNALSYLPILADLEQSGAVNICNSRYIVLIRGTLARKGYDKAQRAAINTWKIGRCSVGL